MTWSLLPDPNGAAPGDVVLCSTSDVYPSTGAPDWTPAFVPPFSEWAGAPLAWVYVGEYDAGSGDGLGYAYSDTYSDAYAQRYGAGSPWMPAAFQGVPVAAYRRT